MVQFPNLTSPLVSHSHALHFISNMTSTFNLHDLLPSSFPISVKGERLNFKGGGPVGCCWLLPWRIWFAICSHPSIIMWRRNRGNCYCSECSIGKLQDQMKTQQEEIAYLKLQTEQQAQQLQAQEQRHNAKMPLVMRTVNKNYSLICYIHRSQHQHQHGIQELIRPSTFVESRASNEVFHPFQCPIVPQASVEGQAAPPDPKCRPGNGGSASEPGVYKPTSKLVSMASTVVYLLCSFVVIFPWHFCIISKLRTELTGRNRARNIKFF
jgi:hypothetical protein